MEPIASGDLMVGVMFDKPLRLPFGFKLRFFFFVNLTLRPLKQSCVKPDRKVSTVSAGALSCLFTGVMLI